MGRRPFWLGLYSVTSSDIGSEDLNKDYSRPYFDGVDGVGGIGWEWDDNFGVEVEVEGCQDLDDFTLFSGEDLHSSTGEKSTFPTRVLTLALMIL